MDDLRLACRRLLRRPGPAIAGALALGAGIGTAAATWSLLTAVLLRPLPVREPARLQVLGEVSKREGQPGVVRNAFIYPIYPFIRDSNAFENVAAQWEPMSLLVEADDVSATKLVVFASHDLLEILGVHVPLGRTFTPDDDRRGATPVAILTDRYWRETFNASPGVIGRTVKVRNATVTIVGVAARGFKGIDISRPADLYLPLHTIADVGPSGTNYFAEPNRGSSPTAGTVIIGRLRSGENATQATTRLSTVEQYSGRTSAASFLLTGINTAAVPVTARDGMTQFTRLLGATVGLLLLIGCASAGLLILMRTEARRGEFAVCLALGASRFRLAKGVFLEGAILAAIGSALALPISWWLFWGAREFQLPGNVTIALLELSLDGSTVLYSLASGVVATLAISIIAGVFGLATNLDEALHQRAASSPVSYRRRAVCVAAQVAVTLALLSGAGLFVRSLIAAMRLNSGLDTTHLLVGNIALGQYFGPDAPRVAAFFEDLSTRLAANPAIGSMAYSVRQGGMSTTGTLNVDGLPRAFPSFVGITMVNPDYFRMIGIPLLQGRDFSLDDRQNGHPAVIVSESFARILANGGNPLGHRIQMPFRRPDSPAAVTEVVGVVGDVVSNVSILEPFDMYFPIAQMGPVLSRELVVRPAGDKDVARREIVNTIKQIDPVVRPAPFRTLEERISQQMRRNSVRHSWARWASSLLYSHCWEPTSWRNPWLSCGCAKWGSAPHWALADDNWRRWCSSRRFDSSRLESSWAF